MAPRPSQALRAGPRPHRPRSGGLAPLRVAILFHEGEAVGAGIAAMRLLTPLSSYGWSPTGLFAHPGALVDHPDADLDRYVHPGRPLALSWWGWGRPPGRVRRLRRTPAYLAGVRRALLAARPHVVHANTLHSLPEAAVARRLGLPVVVYVHECPPADAKALASMLWAGRIADVLVGGAEVVSRSLRRVAGRTPVHLVYEGAPDVPAIPRSPGPWTVGTVGTICHRKGTDVFIRAASLVRERRPGIRFEHVGGDGVGGDPAFDAMVRSQARPLVEDGTLAMRGWQPSLDALPDWNLFVLPSRGELFPLSTLEAMASGLPVVASRVGGLPEQIVAGRTGVLVPADDAQALADAVIRLHDDPATCARLATAGRERVRTRFSLEQQARGLHEAYLTALNLRFAPPAARRATRSGSEVRR